MIRADGAYATTISSQYLGSAEKLRGVNCELEIGVANNPNETKLGVVNHRKKQPVVG